MKEFTIYYADDDDDDLFFFEEAVEALSAKNRIEVKLHLLKNGEHLLDSIDKKKLQNSVVFLDLNMPLKSGFELLQDIRNAPDIKGTPVIIYSTSANENNIYKSKKLGANYYAVKPTNFTDLIDIITKAVSFNWKSYRHNPDPFLFNKVAI
ncbi:response regulator [Aquimarina agarivorans]|uniref:response regulator n=1 Tax=Aquimarina agarivorans TaxID=980584 RepID=UPI000248FCD1|nr:response regulator [Aquimarina agarivorans]